MLHGHVTMIHGHCYISFNNFIKIESEWHKISRKMYGLNTNVKPTNNKCIGVKLGRDYGNAVIINMCFSANG